MEIKPSKNPFGCFDVSGDELYVEDIYHEKCSLF